MRKLRDTSGLILTEALIAVVLLMTATMIASSIIKQALETNALSRDYLIAHNLASEGIEAMKSFRSSNWLKCNPELYPDQWLHVGLDSDNCAGSGDQMAVDDHYVVYEDADSSEWALNSSGIDLDLAADPANADSYNLSTSVGVDADADADAAVDGDEDDDDDDDDDDAVDSAIEGEFEAGADADAGTSEPSRFYRSVVLDDIDPDNEWAEFTVNIQWYERGAGSQERGLERSFHLYNIQAN